MNFPQNFDDDSLTWDKIDRRTQCQGPLYAILIERDLTAKLNWAGLKFEDYDGNQFWLRVEDHHEAGVEWSTGTLYKLRNFFGPDSLLGERTTGCLRSAPGFSVSEASEEGGQETDWATTREAGRNDDADPEANGADKHMKADNRQADGPTKVERERVADLVTLQPTKNAELAERWGLDGGSEVHAYLKGQLDDYYYRDNNSLIRATDAALTVVNAHDSRGADDQSSQTAPDVDTQTSLGTSSELLDPAAYTVTLLAGKLDEVDDLDDLKQIEKAERDGTDRTGAKEAIRERRRELKADATDEPVPEHGDVAEDSDDAEENLLGDIKDEFSLDL